MACISNLDNHAVALREQVNTSLDSRNHVLNKLQSLYRKELDKVREAFIKNSLTCFKKSFSYHLPFGTKDAYVREIMAADLNKLAGLIWICGFLMQTKAYLFWRV